MNHFDLEYLVANLNDDKRSSTLDDLLEKDVKFLNASTANFQWYHGNLNTKNAEDLLIYRQKIERNKNFETFIFEHCLFVSLSNL
jgi:hypothetical protein